MENYRFYEGNLDMMQTQSFTVNGGAILYWEEGEATLQIGTQSFELKGVAVAMLLPESVVQLTNVRQPVKAMLWDFAPDFFEKLNASFSPTFFHMVVSNPVFQLEKDSDNDRAIRLTMELAQLLCTQLKPVNVFHSEMRIRNLAQNLVVSVADFAQPMMEGRDGVVDRKRQLYRQFIIEVCHHCKKEHYIDFYCDKLCISRRYLSQIVKECNPRYTPQYIILEHLNFKIKRALKMTDLTISQIADDFNFQSQSNLSAFFIRNNGISPSEFRNS